MCLFLRIVAYQILMLCAKIKKVTRKARKELYDSNFKQRIFDFEKLRLWLASEKRFLKTWTNQRCFIYIEILPYIDIAGLSKSIPLTEGECTG